YFCGQKYERNENKSCLFYFSLRLAHSREGLVLGSTQAPKCFSRFKRSCRSCLSHKPCTAQTDSACPLLIPRHAERLRLKAFALPQCLLCTELLPDLGKTGGR